MVLGFGMTLLRSVVKERLPVVGRITDRSTGGSDHGDVDRASSSTVSCSSGRDKQQRGWKHCENL
jgi:hypothetical protein